MIDPNHLDTGKLYWHIMAQDRYARDLARSRKRQRRMRVGILLTAAIWAAAIVVYGIFNAY